MFEWTESMTKLLYPTYKPHDQVPSSSSTKRNRMYRDKTHLTFFAPVRTTALYA
jgi:hypothetical protein